MDRTMIAPWKAEEKELSEKLYQKLQGLTLLYPCTEEFRKQVTDDMFLKPNQTAFFQVMHYLLRLLDAAEFKKRFYWPITDKRAESNFRASTVEYLKQINEKHQLNWNIKSYLVVMPGGMKFINFLLDFIAFVVQELTRRREKELAGYIDCGQASQLNLKRMLRQNSFYKEYASAYLSEVDGQMGKLRDRIQVLHSSFAAIAHEAGVSKAVLLQNAFLADFNSENERICRERFCARAAEISSLQEPLTELKGIIDNFQTKVTESKLDSDEMRRSLRAISEQFSSDSPLDDDLFANPANGDAIQMNSLLVGFNSIHTAVEEALDTTEDKPRSSEFLINELAVLKHELQLIEAQSTDFQKMLNTKLKKRDSERKQQKFQTPMRTGGVFGCNADRIRENSLVMKFVSTPPIKLEALDNNRSVNMRLPLLDDFHAIAMDFPAGPPRSVRKAKPTDNSFELNSTMNKSKIIDPMQLLRTINKDSSKMKPSVGQHNLSVLSTKWKERQNLFGGENDPVTPKKTLHPRDAVSVHAVGHVLDRGSITPTSKTSPFSPFNTNERTRIARSQYNATEGGGVGGGGGGGNLSGTSILYTSKLSAVKKVQDASLNFQNLSTSPSGRLDPLVLLDGPDVPKLQVNDITLNNSGAPAETSSKDGIENNANFANTQQKFVFKINMPYEEDDLLNISDSVLKDLIM